MTAWRRDPIKMRPTAMRHRERGGGPWVIDSGVFLDTSSRDPEKLPLLPNKFNTVQVISVFM